MNAMPEFRELKANDILRVGDHTSFNDWEGYAVLTNDEDPEEIGMAIGALQRQYPGLRVRRPVGYSAPTTILRELDDTDVLQAGDDVDHGRGWQGISPNDMAIGRTIGELRREYPKCVWRRAIPVEEAPASIEVTLTLADGIT